MIYPGPLTKQAGPRDKPTQKPVRTHTLPGKRRKLSFHVWLDQAVGVELRQLAQRKGVSLSALFNGLLKDRLLQSLHHQHDALLEPLVTKALRGEQSGQRRLIVFMYLELIQTRRMLVNLLGRTKAQRAMDAQTLNRICDSTRQQARQDLLSRTSPLDALTRRELRDWLMVRRSVLSEAEDGEGEP